VSEFDDVADAIDDILSVLPTRPEAEPAAADDWSPAVWLEVQGKLRPLACPVNDASAQRRLRTSLAAATQAQHGPVTFAIAETDLVVRVAPLVEGRTAFVARITDADLAAFLGASFPDLRLPGALRHLLRLHLAGIGLKDGARRDGRSVETRKRQSQQLRAAFEADDLATIGRQVAAALVLALDRFVAPPGHGIDRTLQEYVARFMPRGTRLFSLAAQDGTPVPVIDMGPAGGRPILVLHPMALPDIRPAEIAALDRLNLRLVWPLRHGTCAPGAAALPPRDHLAQALSGAQLALGVTCGGRAPVLAFAAASRVGLDLATVAPEAVSALHVAGVCLRDGRPEAGPRRLARGVLALAARNPGLLDPVMEQIVARLRRPGVFEDFLRRQFSDSAADLAVVETDLNGPHGSARFRTVLLESAASARHDFLFQSDLGWDRVPPDLDLHLHHGGEDRIHPLPLIAALADRLPGARLHVHPQAGQLFHHDHLTRLLERMAAGMGDA